MLLLLLLFYKQGGKQVTGRHSMGIGLGLFCWLYSRGPSLSHSSNCTGQNNNRIHRGRIKLVVSIQKNPIHTVSMLMSQFFNGKFLILEIKPM